METNTAKHFVLQLGSLASLYISLSFLLVLLFGVINLQFPDPGEAWYVADSAASSVRLGIAMVMVFLPTYLILTRTVNRIRRQETSGTYLALTKWLIYLSLLVGGAVLLGDLVAVIMAFLEGEITTRFILKALAVLVTIGAAFYYYILDARGYWVGHERESVYYGVVAGVIALAAVIYGFTLIGSPTTAQERRLDQRQIEDLTNIQSRVENYYVLNQRLPGSLSDLPDQDFLPTAPEGRAPYIYKQTDGGFALCADFAHASDRNQSVTSPVYDEKGPIKNPWNWEHAAGEYCFERVVSPLSAPVKQ